MLKLLKLRNYGWTNLLYLADRNDERVLVKKFCYNYKTVMSLGFYLLFCLFSMKRNGGFSVSNKARIRNEIEAKAILKKLKIRVPRLLSVNDDSLVLENVRGENLSEFFKNQDDLQIIEKIAFKKGVEVGKIHNYGCALIDNRTTNTIVTENLETCSVDHEFFLKDAKDFQKELDIMTLMSTVPSDKFEAFHKGFWRGYKKITKRDAIIYRKEVFTLVWLALNFLIRSDFLK